MSIPVIWVSYRKPDIISRGYWDQAMLEGLFDHSIWRPVGMPEFEHYDGFEEFNGDGAIVVLPARHHGDMQNVSRLNLDIARLKWCLLILTGDEESVFPWRSIHHPNMKLWVMTPHPERHADCPARFIGTGYAPGTVEALATMPVEKTLDWFFSGQVTHIRRRDCVTELKNFGRGRLVETAGFTQGLSREEYTAGLAGAKVAPCPSGPVSPDSFRLFEALEAGCVPLADSRAPEGPTGFWDMLFGDHPIPLIDEWDQLRRQMHTELAAWPTNANRISAWWQQYKRQLAYDLQYDLGTLTLDVSPLYAPNDLITVLVPTSPIPSHPDTSVIEQTIGSIREQLPDAEIIIMCDGIRDEQLHRRDSYQEYLRRLMVLTQRWHNVVPLLSEQHLHQGGMTRLALDMVQTPLVLFVEHDTPMCGYVPWGDLVRVAFQQDVKVIRFHHEAQVLDVHQHLMLDKEPQLVGRLVPMLRTVQWSQRPHLARTAFYRSMIETYFGPASRTMIEDVMYGVVSEAFILHGEEGWKRFGLWMYAPPGDIKRSWHTDGRASDSKYRMIFSYPDDGAPPEGAPYPTARRTD